MAVAQKASQGEVTLELRMDAGEPVMSASREASFRQGGQQAGRLFTGEELGQEAVPCGKRAWNQREGENGERRSPGTPSCLSQDTSPDLPGCPCPLYVCFQSESHTSLFQDSRKHYNNGLGQKQVATC